MRFRHCLSGDGAFARAAFCAVGETGFRDRSRLFEAGATKHDVSPFEPVALEGAIPPVGILRRPSYMLGKLRRILSGKRLSAEW